MADIGSSVSRPPSRAASPPRSGRAREQRAAGVVRSGVPVLEARPGGPAERYAARWHGRHPALVFLSVVLGGLVLLAGVSILLGVLVTHVLITSLGLGGPDGDAVRTLAHHRDATLTSASKIGSTVGGAPVLPIVVAVIGLVCAAARRWRIAAFAIVVLAVESSAYRLTTLVVHRQRPGVHRLEDLAANASYPSGHTAATVAVYAGLVLLITSRVTNTLVRALAWTFVILMVSFVALSRMYRGMHHPLDVAGGALVGIGAILLLLFACRAAGAAAQMRDRARAPR